MDFPAKDDDATPLIRDQSTHDSQTRNGFNSDYMVNTHDDDENHMVETEKYWYRWYVLAIFSAFAFWQGAIWNTWSPIDQSAACAYGFTDSDISLLTNWGNILFLVAMPIVMWMLFAFGLRLPNILSAFLMALGTGLRCLPAPVHVLKYLMHSGQILNGISGCVIMATPPQISIVWFPLNERVTATSLTSLFNFLGAGFAYILGPLMVQQPPGNSSHNASVVENNSSSYICNSTEENRARHEIKNLMYLEFAFSAFVFLCMLIYFPNNPPKPPSASASIGRMNFRKGLTELLKRKEFVVITITFAMAIGGYGSWTGVFSVLLDEVNVSQDEAGLLGFVMTIVGCVVGIIFGWLADRFKGNIKLMYIALYVVSFFAYVYFIIITEGWIKVKGLEFSHVGLWIDCIISGIALNAVVPLGLEMAADAAYPTSESISASVLMWLYSLLGFIFLLAFQFTDATVGNYLMLAFIGVSIPLLLCFTTEPSRRMQIDMDNLATKKDRIVIGRHVTEGNIIAAY